MSHCLKVVPCDTYVCSAAQSSPTFCDPMYYRPGSSVHGIFLARTLEKVAISYSRGIFSTQGQNPYLICFLHWQVGSLPLHQMDIDG